MLMLQYLTAFASVFPLQADRCDSKYAAAVRQRAEAAGEDVRELDAALFGLSR